MVIICDMSGLHVTCNAVAIIRDTFHIHFLLYLLSCDDSKGKNVTFFSSMDQVKGVLTLQGEVLTQAVSL